MATGDAHKATDARFDKDAEIGVVGNRGDSEVLTMFLVLVACVSVAIAAPAEGT